MNASQGELFDTNPAPWDVDAAADAMVATVVFPEAPAGEFDYLIPDGLRTRLQAGARVRVPLGRGNRLVLAYCIRIANLHSPPGRLKEVREIVDDPPLVSAEILDLVRWISDYYLCEMGQVMETAVPASVRGKAGTREVTFLHVPTNVAAKITQLKLPRKQAAILQFLASSTRPLTQAEVTQAIGCTAAPIKALRDKELIRAEKKRVFQETYEAGPIEDERAWAANPDQQRALDVINDALHRGEHETILLHGVTGSGKTEVYIQAIEEVIRFGRQAIVLVPEISLTPQTRRRFQSRLDGVAVLHSNLSPVERHAEWRRIVQGEVRVVVGARSAVFAPVPNLGLIVIDEEHESTFKQENAPRYHARDVALQRARTARVPLILGSATPALESWYRAQQGDYRLVQLNQRVLDRHMPDVATIDLRNEYKHLGSRGALSRPLQQAMKVALAEGGQVILLLNRRGFSTHIQCPSCGVAMNCKHCEIALTHHRDADQAVCHYCDYKIRTPDVCPDCGFSGIRFGGLGTQKLEDEVRNKFPGSTILRMDTDSMRSRGSHEAALNRFRHGEVQILLGTQMIAKGLDFPNVTLVGVVNADTALHLPDFRSGERTFQLVTQVAGRTGRGEKGGRVLVQTFSPDHPSIQAAVEHNFERFATAELPIRTQFGYPPIAAVVRLVFRGESEQTTELFAGGLADRLQELLERQHTSARVLGPVPAPITKIRNKYRYHMLIQTSDLDGVRQAIREAGAQMPVSKEVQWIVDIDAASML